MDFTFLFIVILMVLAAQSNNFVISGALFVALLATSKDKYMLAAAFVGGFLVLMLNVEFEGKTLVVLGGMFLILVLLAREDTVHPHPQGAGGYY